MKVLALWFAIWFAALSPARAAGPSDAAFEAAWQKALKNAEPKPEPDVFAQMDGQFGAYVVGPLATVMFFDIVMWDDTLPAGEGIGKVEAGKGHVLQITGYEGGKGYARQQGFVVPAVEPVLAAPVSKRYGPIDVQLKTEEVAGKRMVMAHIAAQPVDLSAVGLQPWDPTVAGDQPVAIVTVPGLGFPVSVNRSTGQVEPTEGVAPAGAVPIEVGSTVFVPSQEAERTLVGGQEGAWHVLAPEVEWSDAPLPNPENVALPVVVAWLVFGAVFFTLRMMFINLRGFPHAVLVTMGRYDDPDHDGEISHFQALSSALSATVGLGNISGVAIAIGIGGPGAVFWMWVAGFLGMSSKFTECTLGQMYRVRKADGSVSGGPMHYLDKGLAELGLGPVGKVLSIVFALMCIGGSFGGGNMFQANQSFEAVATVMPGIAPYSWLYGLMLMIAVGVVIIGGIKRIGAAASVVVPLMCGIYMLAGLYILVINAAIVPAAFGSIVSQAFSPDAGMGGMVGVLAIGFQRASFSNEAGVGSASIAHSAATTNEPVREGIVALLEPFIDTIIVCSVTALVVVLTDVHVAPGSGIGPTMAAFETVLPWFPYVLAFAAMMFAFSTMVSWSYYGESCATFLFGEGARLPYRLVFLVFVFIGSVLKLGNVLDFSDLMILGMAFPNILGAILLSGKVKAALDTYLSDLGAGKFDTGA
ncbi:MAG: alanine/glycine:cation symporter family protein [Myxococcota bacterium]